MISFVHEILEPPANFRLTGYDVYGKSCICQRVVVHGCNHDNSIRHRKYLRPNPLSNTVHTVFETQELTPRLLNAAQSLRNPTRPSMLGLYGLITYITAILRELTYPQPLLFERWTFFDPPPLGRIYLVVLYIIFILILLLKDSIVSGPWHYESLAYRAAWCSVSQVPLIFLLAQKNSIVGFLIGSSHERLNWAHRTVARMLLFTVTIHFSFFWREWSIYHVVESEIVMMPMVKYGLGAYFTLMWIVFSSFAPIRNLRYEVFVVQHILSFVVFLTLIMLHIPVYARVYIYCAVGFYAADRLLRTVRLLYRNLAIFHRGKRGMLTCRAHIVALPGHATRITIKDPPLQSWSPGQYVFLSFPTMSPFQSHPFTIASIPTSNKELEFIVRAKAGFSRRIYKRAVSLLPTAAEPANEKSFAVLIDGPYGCPPNLLQYDTLVLIAGSTGVTFTIPILLSAVEASNPHCVRRIEFLWIVKAGSHFEWCAVEIGDAVQAAQDRGIELVITCCVTCDPSYTTNNPIRHPFLRRSESRTCSCKTESSSSLSSTESLNPNKEKATVRTSIATDLSPSETAGKGCCCCSAGLAEDALVCVQAGRPDLRGVIERNLRTARGETGVAVCGPVGLMARTRTAVAELSDERGAGKGTGAYGVSLFGEGFGW